jgi:hypothetical protein
MLNKLKTTISPLIATQRCLKPPSIITIPFQGKWTRDRSRSILCMSQTVVHYHQQREGILMLISMSTTAHNRWKMAWLIMERMRYSLSSLNKTTCHRWEERTRSTSIEALLRTRWSISSGSITVKRAMKFPRSKNPQKQTPKSKDNSISWLLSRIRDHAARKSLSDTEACKIMHLVTNTSSLKILE